MAGGVEVLPRWADQAVSAATRGFDLAPDARDTLRDWVGRRLAAAGPEPRDAGVQLARGLTRLLCVALDEPDIPDRPEREQHQVTLTRLLLASSQLEESPAGTWPFRVPPTEE